MSKSVKLTCNIQLENLVISSEDVKKVFDVSNGSIKDQEYQNVICEVLKGKYGCSFNVRDAKKKAINVGSIVLICIMNKEKVYRLKYYKSEIKENVNLNCEVYTNIDAKCTHTENDIRNLMKDKRNETKNSLKDSTVSKVSLF